MVGSHSELVGVWLRPIIVYNHLRTALFRTLEITNIYNKRQLLIFPSQVIGSGAALHGALPHIVCHQSKDSLYPEPSETVLYAKSSQLGFGLVVEFHNRGLCAALLVET